MPQYIRVFVPGGTFFFSFTLPERQWKLLTGIRGTGIHNLECAADDNVLILLGYC
jgi:hypothetical protein